MKAQQISQFVQSVCSCLRLSQAKTLSALVPAAMCMERASLAQLGRALALNCGVAVKHCIKRVDRFVGNDRIEPTEAMRGLVQWLAKPRDRLLVSLDWVDIRQFHCLVAATRLRGRAIPLAWGVYRYEDYYRSQNNIEYGLLHVLRTMIPQSVRVTILADRGFGRTEMARECQKLGLHYIIRIEPTVWVGSRRFSGILKDYPIRRGHSCLMSDVCYRKEKPVSQHVAIVWQCDREHPWYLMTDDKQLRAKALSKVFGKRMTIEEYFRDTKSKRNGFALRLIQIKSSERLSRLLLILALAYIFLVAIGLHASKRFNSGQWCSNNRKTECSLFTIGKTMQHKAPPSINYLLRMLRREIFLQNWG
jgi:hypothetical protein